MVGHGASRATPLTGVNATDPPRALSAPSGQPKMATSTLPPRTSAPSRPDTPAIAPSVSAAMQRAPSRGRP
eukprot:4605317-Pyramimonas_sp.AAC.1